MIVEEVDCAHSHRGQYDSRENESLSSSSHYNDVSQAS